MRRILVGIIRLYKKIVSPLLPASCRFYPTCSDYAREAIDKHGALKGVLLAGKRISKCHPFHEGGIDYVPDTLENSALKSEEKVGKL